jgi:molybdopterin molybdotransferase
MTPSPLLGLDDALARIVASVHALPSTEIDVIGTWDAHGRVLAHGVVSQVNVPPFDNSAMDGYAVCTADLQADVCTLPVSQRIAAGDSPCALVRGTAARIFTGAPLPLGADAVVMQEHCEVLEMHGAVRINMLPKPAQAIRRCGEDVRAGDVVLARGARLSPQALGLAAACGAAQLTVVRRVRVALFSTGNELVMPGEPLPPGGIYNSNRFMLRAMVEMLGGQCTDFGNVPDQLLPMREMLRLAAQDHDVILTSGGVSVGEEDHLRAAVQHEGVLDLWKIAIKPGKPLAFGRVSRSRAGFAWLLGLPGNPVSSFVTFLLAVRPVIKRLQGTDSAMPQGVLVRADFDWPGDKRREFLRVRRNAQDGLELFSHQGSGVLTSVVWGDGLLDNPAGQEIQRGDMVRYVGFGDWTA